VDDNHLVHVVTAAWNILAPPVPRWIAPRFSGALAARNIARPFLEVLPVHGIEETILQAARGVYVLFALCLWYNSGNMDFTFSR